MPVELISVESYHALGERGLLDERTEFLRGRVVSKPRQSPLHCYTVSVLQAALESVLSENHHTRLGQPLTLADSEPEPDLAIVLGGIHDYFHAHPATAEIVMEVCVGTEERDRAKLQIYADAGVKECWLILAETKTVERYSGLQHNGYRQVQITTGDLTLSSTVIANVALPFPRLFRT